MRSLWLVRLNAALRDNGTTYSRFAGALKKQNIEINRKMLAELANVAPDSFASLVKEVSAVK